MCDLLTIQIHQRQVEASMWGSQLDSFSWRIDVKSKARHIEQLNEPTAIIEMKLKNDTDKVIMKCIRNYRITE